MTKNITRTIKTTHVFLAEAKFEGGQLVAYDLPSLDLLGEVADDKILKEAKKLYPEVNILIKEKQVSEVTYAMPVDTFIELASIVEPVAEPVE
jgi:hypothetical protein|nr:MAG TPA: dsDNA binding protein [Caudoviricetes sp.]